MLILYLVLASSSLLMYKVMQTDLKISRNKKMKKIENDEMFVFFKLSDKETKMIKIYGLSLNFKLLMICTAG